MFKKTCSAVCLLASTSSASTSVENWEGVFTMKNGLTICRKSNGDIFTKSEDGIDAGPYSTFSLSRFNAKNTDDNIELDRTLTPQNFFKALVKTGEVTAVQPPALSEFLRPAAQSTLTDMESLSAMFQAKYGKLPNDEETSFLKQMLEQAKAPVSAPAKVFGTKYVTRNVTAITRETITGEAGQPVCMLETHYVDEDTSQ